MIISELRNVDKELDHKYFSEKKDLERQEKRKLDDMRPMIRFELPQLGK